MQAIMDAFSLEYTEEELENKYSSKMEKCEELSKDENFEKELQECLSTLISEE